MYDAEVYQVMIASPADITTERKIVMDVVHDWNNVHSSKTRMVLLPAGWETHSIPLMGDRPQEIINKQVLKSSDLLVGIFWSRIGTPTGEAISGTVEEIERHMAAGKPVMLYFSSAPVMKDSVDEEQYRHLLEFKNWVKTRGLYESYEDTSDFASKFSRQLARLINTHEYFDLSQAEAGITPVTVDESSMVESLSPSAKELLEEASQDRFGTILRFRTNAGPIVQTNQQHFGSPGDPRDQARWTGALQELEDAEFVEDETGNGSAYRVTYLGYRVIDLFDDSDSGPASN
jgi:hypothetical protein